MAHGLHYEGSPVGNDGGTFESLEGLQGRKHHMLTIDGSKLTVKRISPPNKNGKQYIEFLPCAITLPDGAVLTAYVTADPQKPLGASFPKAAPVAAPLAGPSTHPTVEVPAVKLPSPETVKGAASFKARSRRVDPMTQPPQVREPLKAPVSIAPKTADGGTGGVEEAVARAMAKLLPDMMAQVLSNMAR